MSRFYVGDEVRKTIGYPFIGTVQAVYADQEKCCVRHADGWDHIFNDKQLAYDHPEYQYLDLLKECLQKGNYREGRNGGTYSLFGRQICFNLEDGFPLITTKKIFTKAIVAELLWFLSGSTSNNDLTDQGVHIWDKWAGGDGGLGPVYGKQWRDFGGVDQIVSLIEGLKRDPYGRRHIVSAWNPPELDAMALPPCHCLFQFYVSDGKLSCQLYQRSADLPVGVPFNIASYALLTHLIAREVGLKVGEFVHTFGDVHIYQNQIDAVHEQLSRTPLPLPYVLIETNKNIFKLQTSDIVFMHYNSHPAIKMEVSA